MEKNIEKCKICEQPFWSEKGKEYQVGTFGVCPDCVKIADKKEERELNQPDRF